MGLRLTDHTGQMDALQHRASVQGHNLYGDEDRIKRIFDVTVALIALIIVFPLILVVALLIRLQDGHSAIFYQVRFGRHGRSFRCYKLRSMMPDAKERLEHILNTDPEARRQWEQGQKLNDDPRITPLGHFIRKTSIDELPQLWNVLKGEMSLVGPRPIVENEISKYGESFAEYSSVRPGLTGLWQVKGRSDTTYEQRVALDVAYAQDRSFWGDVKILVLTVPAVFASRGAR